MQSKLQQQLHNSKANEQLLQGELESCKQLLAQTRQQHQELQAQVQLLQRQSEADAKEAKAAAERAVLQLQKQLSSDASTQVSSCVGKGCYGLYHCDVTCQPAGRTARHARC